METALIVVNGELCHDDYNVQEGDVIGVRIFPKEVFTGALTVVSAYLFLASVIVTAGVIIAYQVSPDFRAWVKGLFTDDASADTTKGNQNPSISGQSNQSAKGKPIPLTLGKRLLTPYWIGKPFTKPVGTYGEEQEYYALYLLGYKDMDVSDIRLKYSEFATNRRDGKSDGAILVTGNESTLAGRSIKIDGTAFNSISDKCQIELCNAQKSALYPQRVIQESVGIQIQYVEGYKNVPILRYSATNPMAIEMEVGFDGLYRMNDEGKKRETSVELQFEYSIGGKEQEQWFDSSEHFEYPTFIEAGATRSKLDSYFARLHPTYTSIEDDEYVKHVFTIVSADKASRSDMTLYWRVKYVENLYKKTKWIPFGVTPMNEDNMKITYDSTTGHTKFSGKISKVMRFVARKEFTVDDIKGMLPKESAQENYIAMRVRRVYPDSTDSKYCDKVFLTTTRTECFDFDAMQKKYEDNTLDNTFIPQYPINNQFVLDNTMVMAVKLSASEAIKGNIEAVNCILQSKAPIIQNGEWTTQEYATSNPASLVYKMFYHPMLKSYAYRSDILDKVKLAELYEFCENSRYECNMSVTSQIKFTDIIKKILECGHSFLIPSESKYTFFIDKAREDADGDITPDAILNSHNVLKEGLSNSKEFEDVPDGLEITYIDADAGYTEQTIRCYFDSSIMYNNEALANAKIESVKYDAITNNRLAWRMGKYNLLKRHLRPEAWNRGMSFTGEVVDVGSYVEIQDDSISVGIGEGGTVRRIIRSNGAVTGFTTDSGIMVDTLNRRYGVKFIVSRNYEEPHAFTYELDVTKTGYTKKFTLKTPIIESEFHLREGDIVSFGQFDRITTGALCLGKTRSENNTFSIASVPYDKDVYYYDDPNAKDDYMPSFKPKMTEIDTVTTPSEVPSSPLTIENIENSQNAMVNYTDSAILSAQIAGTPMYTAVVDASVIKKISENEYSPSTILCKSYETTKQSDGTVKQKAYATDWVVTINEVYENIHENESSFNINLNEEIQAMITKYSLPSLVIKNVRIVSKTTMGENDIVWEDAYLPVLASDSGFLFILENNYEAYECSTKVDGVSYPNGYILEERTTLVTPHFYDGLQEVAYGEGWSFGVITTPAGFRIELNTQARSVDGSLKVTALEGTAMAESGVIDIPVFVKSSKNIEVSMGYSASYGEVSVGYVGDDGEVQVGYIKAGEDSGTVVLPFQYKKLLDSAKKIQAMNEQIVQINSSVGILNGQIVSLDGRITSNEEILDDMASDSKFTPVEKSALKIIRSQDDSEYASMVSFNKCVAYADYNTAYTEWKTYTNNLLADMTHTSSIDVNTFNTKNNNFRTARNALLNEIETEPVYTVVDSVSAIPSSPKAGDFFLAGFNGTVNSVTITKGLVYTYNGKTSKWERDDSPDKMMTAMNDSLELLSNTTDGSIPIVSFCQKLIAMNAVIQNLATQVIELQSNGEIKSKGFTSGVKGFRISEKYVEFNCGSYFRGNFNNTVLKTMGASNITSFEYVNKPIINCPALTETSAWFYDPYGNRTKTAFIKYLNTSREVVIDNYVLYDYSITPSVDQYGTIHMYMNDNITLRGYLYDEGKLHNNVYWYLLPNEDATDLEDNQMYVDNDGFLKIYK